MSSKSSSAAGVRKLKPKSQRAKRALLKRAPQLVTSDSSSLRCGPPFAECGLAEQVDHVKSSILMRGTSTSQIVQDALEDLVRRIIMTTECDLRTAAIHQKLHLQHLLRAPNSRNMHKKSDIRPFEARLWTWLYGRHAGS